MSILKRRLCSQLFLLHIVAVSSLATVEAQHLVVTNAIQNTSAPVVLELPLDQVRAHIKDIEHSVAEDEATHKRLPTQIFPPQDGSPALLLIALQTPVSGRLILRFVPANMEDRTEPLVFGREAPERKDDFAWENQFVAYRVYGPALEAAGEIASGIDVWSKRVPNLVIDSFYKHDAEGTRTHNPALSYHKDDGIGLDSYLVGPSRGCGGTAIFSKGRLWPSRNYTRLKLVSCGPVRFAFELSYAPWDADGVQVTETKRITLDAGSHLNKIESTFTFAGTQTLDAAAGLAIHPGADFSNIQIGAVLSVWDTPQDPTAGRIATGMISLHSQHTKVKQADGHGLMIFHIRSGQKISYYAGSGWSKADMPTQQAWNVYLKDFLMQKEHPLQTRWKNDDRGGKR